MQIEAPEIERAPQRAEPEHPLVLVTGSSGLIGRRLVAALAPRYRVVGFDLEPPSEESRTAGFIACDLTDDARVEAALAELSARFGERLASVVHLAAWYDFSGEPSPMYRELTVEGSRRLLRGLRRFQVEQFVFSSSLLVMKPVEAGETIEEGSPTAAAWAYPRSKLEAEAAISEAHGAIPVCVLRLAGVYDEDGHSIPIAQQLDRIARRRLESLFFPGDADHGQSFVHLEDAVDALVAAVDHRRQLGTQELFLVGEPDVVSYREMQRILGRELHGRAWPAIRVPRGFAKAGAWLRDKLPGGDPFLKPWMVEVADAHRPIRIERARERLGWRPRHRLRDTLPEMARRMRSAPEAWRRENGLAREDGDG